MSKSIGDSLRLIQSDGPLVAVVACLLLLGLHGGAAYADEVDVAEDAALPETVPTASEEGGCVESASVMCLQEGRYEVTVEVLVNAEAAPQPAKVVRGGSRPIGTRESGLFYFFDPSNWEMLLKVLDACGVNQHNWVYAAAATDVGYTITVRDTTLPADGSVVHVKKYTKEPGRPAPALTDAAAFPDSCASSSA